MTVLTLIGKSIFINNQYYNDFSVSSLCFLHCQSVKARLLFPPAGTIATENWILTHDRVMDKSVDLEKESASSKEFVGEFRMFRS